MKRIISKSVWHFVFDNKFDIKDIFISCESLERFCIVRHLHGVPHYHMAVEFNSRIDITKSVLALLMSNEAVDSCSYCECVSCSYDELVNYMELNK